MQDTENELRIWIENTANEFLEKLPKDKQLLALGYLAGLAADATLREEEPEQQPPAP